MNAAATHNAGTSLAVIAAATTSPMAQGVTDGLAMPRRRLAVVAVLGAMVLVVLDAAIANIALPSITRALQITPAMSLRIVTSYQIALITALLPCAALGDAIGHRRVFVAGVALFIAASGLCALAPGLTWLVAARFLQGLGGACVMSLGVALLRFAVPRHRIGAAIGWNAVTVALTSAAGPTVGALILSTADWRWLFAVNLPLGAVLLWFAGSLPLTTGSGRRIDRMSVGLNATAFAALFLGAERMATDPLEGGIMLTASLVLFGALVRREWHQAAPLVPIDLLANRSFRLSVMASICCFVGQALTLAALPFYLQHRLHIDPLTTGLLMTPWPIAVAVTAPLAGRLSDKVPTGWLCGVGSACLAAGLAGMALFPAGGSGRALVPFLLLCGVGFGLFQTPNNRSLFLAAPAERAGAAGGMQGTARLVGQTTGAVLLSILMLCLPLEVAARLGFGIAAIVSLAAGLLSVARTGSR